jgi:hypothetical protein
MSDGIRIEVSTLLVGNFVDTAEFPAGIAPGRTEVVATWLVGPLTDDGTSSGDRAERLSEDCDGGHE